MTPASSTVPRRFQPLESAVELLPAFEQVEQAHRPVGTFDGVGLVYADHRQPPALALTRSRIRVSSFSFASSSLRAASHSCGETIGGVSIVIVHLPVLVEAHRVS